MTQETDIQEVKFLNQIKSNWVLIVAIAGLIASWTMFSSRLSNAEQDITDLRIMSSQIQQIQIDIAIVKQQIISINEKIK